MFEGGLRKGDYGWLLLILRLNAYIQSRESILPLLQKLVGYIVGHHSSNLALVETRVELSHPTCTFRCL